MAIPSSIRELLSGRQVSGSKLNSKLLDELLAEGLLLVIPRGSGKSYRARDIEALKRHLMDRDESYRLLEVEGTHEDLDTRGSMAAETGNSKLTVVRSCPGFPVNSYEPIECILHGKPLVIDPQEGSFIFISDWEQFLIPDDVVVIGIENMENFRMIRRQRPFFNAYLLRRGWSGKALFVSRYPQSTDLRRWLCSISNHYIHFGDFDLAGIHIFLSEFQQYLSAGRSSYLIPDDIATRLRSGSSARYDAQYHRFANIHTEDPDLQRLIVLIHTERKAYDQEGYIL